MNLQTIFYVISIISLSIQVVLLLTTVILLVFIIKKLISIYGQVESKFKEAEEFITHPRALAQDVGEAVVSTAINKVSHLFSFNKKKRK